MNDKKTVLCVGPLPPPIHGQSVAFEFACQGMNFNKIIINQNCESNSLIDKIGYTLFVSLKVVWTILTKKIDLIYFTCSRSLLGAFKDVALLLAARVKGIKAVNHLHGADFNKFYYGQPFFVKRLLDFSYGAVDTSIILLIKMEDQFSMFPRMKTKVVSNCYPPSLEEVEISKNEGKVVLVYLSNIIYSKGIFDLLEAFKSLNSDQIEIELKIAGGFLGDDYMSAKDVESKFYETIKEFDSIEYCGLVRGDRKDRLLAQSDIMILPSFYRSEALPISIIEAMRSSCAIITTDHNYLKEIISSDNGLIVPVKEPLALGGAIMSLCRDIERLREVQNCNLALAKDQHTLSIYQDSINCVLEDILN
jgi:glycosyltransferase involved in cell wall biosynthesis